MVKAYENYRAVIDNLEESRLLMKDADADIRAMAEEEVESAEVELEDLQLALQKLLLPKDPNDEKNVFLEIRAGTGGDEAAIFFR